MSGYHLYAFRIGHTSYLDIDDDWPDDSVDPASVLLGDLVGPGDKFTFEHDFGDGGPWGYADLLEAIADPEHERHAELLEWIGGGFDPEAFDPAEVDRIFATVFDLSS